MIKLLWAITLLFSMVARGDVTMNLKNMQYNEQYEFYQDINSLYKNDYFILHLIKFIKLNMDILVLPDAITELNKENNITFRFYPPKIISKPILEGIMDYAIVISPPLKEQLGKYYAYKSWISREAKELPWNKIKMYGSSFKRGEYQGFGYFKKEDFEELGLTFKQKKLLKHLDGKEWLKYSSVGHKEFTQEVYESISKKAYAIYEFETTRNGHKLKLSFTVAKEKYVENPTEEDLPYEWSQLFIERLD